MIRDLTLRDVQTEFSRLEDDLASARRSLSSSISASASTSVSVSTSSTTADFTFDGGTISGTSTGLMLDLCTITDPGLILDFGGIV